MRLTLRTMLAYMDEILEPADHEDIGRKIEESEFATNLMHRIRDVSCRMRLGAPKVSGRGMGLDPNTVAEYLDNTLAGERVPDFEKVCLESDVHLAEVASCHQILTLVLGEAAEVTGELRNRMYAIGTRADEPAVETGARTAAAAAAFSAADGAEPPPLPTPASRAKPEVPDYLRQGSRSRWKPIAIVIALAACLLVAIALAAGDPVLNLLGLGKNETAQNTPKPKQPATATSNGGAADKNADKNADKKTDANANGAKPGDANVIDKSDSKMPDAKTPADDQAAKNGPGDNGAKTGPVAPVTPATSVGPATAGPPTAGPATGGPTAIGPAAPGANVVPPPNPPTPDNSIPPVATGAPPAPLPPAATPPAVTVNTGGPPPEFLVDQRVGRLLSPQEVLLQLDGGKGEWHRAAPGATFSAGDQILTLPTFRPAIILSSGVSLELNPETLVEFQGVEQGIPAVRLRYGRMIILTVGKPDVKIKLTMGNDSGVISFLDAEATAAAEVRFYRQPGSNPEKTEPEMSAVVYSTTGSLEWTAHGKTTAMKAPQRIMLAGDPAAVGGGEHELPRWVAPEPISPLDTRAAQMLNQALDEKRPVAPLLREMADQTTGLGRRAENRSLAARSLALIDEFEPFIDLLNDPDERAVWPIQIESLQAALARGPATAAKVRMALEKQRGKDAPELYRMLWGYTKDDLLAGDAARLVDALDRDNLDFRVLSFYNLRSITGATFNYRPEATAANRQPTMRRWREQLKDGLIVPKAAGAGAAAKTGPAADIGSGRSPTPLPPVPEPPQ